MLDIDMEQPGLSRLVDKTAPFDQLFHGMGFGEGPVWNRRTGELYWVDILGDTIWKRRPGSGAEVVMRPSGRANGMTLDQDGRMLVAGWSSRKIWRFEHDGTTTTLATDYEGEKLNSPNDIVVHSGGWIYWTDSDGGLFNVGMHGEDLQRYLPIQGIYRVKEGGPVEVVVEDFAYPNGIAFSPDETHFYANDSRLAHIRVFDAASDGTVSNGRIFHKMQGIEPGVADGMKVDREGNVYCTGPGGVHVLTPSGELLGRIKIPGFHSTNLAWGDEDWKSLYITSFTSVWKTRVKVPGVPVGG